MKYLIVVAHPDDEVLGAGASIWKWTQQGNQVDVCIYLLDIKSAVIVHQQDIILNLEHIMFKSTKI